MAERLVGVGGWILTSAYRSGTEYDQSPWLRAWLGWVGGILTSAYRSGTEYDQCPWLRAWLVDGWQSSTLLASYRDVHSLPQGSSRAG